MVRRSKLIAVTDARRVVLFLALIKQGFDETILTLVIVLNVRMNVL